MDATIGGETLEFEHMNLREKVADHLRDMILAGRLHGGQRINQEQTAVELGVSKLPVREALLLLEAQGLVINHPRRGAFVQELTGADILDHYSAYGLLSGIAAERAATALTETQRRRLQENLKEFENSKSSSKSEELNLEFHQIILRAGRSNLLASLLGGLGRTLPAEIFYGKKQRGWMWSALQEHRDILDAIMRRDGTAAAEAMARHLRHGGEYAVDQLRKSGALRIATSAASVSSPDNETSARPPRPSRERGNNP